jgi:DNA-binding transcriptional MerR regulator
VSSRSYLSIGDVLTLLRQEFPDVTISKIRFLESQGLVNPERTPSGYRKFYEHDVERLRWVLRQQREHFLPLKVIKDRLEDDGTVTASGAADDGAMATATAAAEPSVDVTATTSVVVETPEPVATAAEVPAPVPTVREPATVGAVAGGGTGSSRRSAPPRTVAPVPNGSGNGSRGASDPAPTKATGEVRAAKVPVGDARESTQSSPPADAEDESQDLLASSDTSISMDELCSASGLTHAAVAELQEYGLLSASVAAGVEYFDEEALTVASVAAKFADYGIEARHLRLYKNAAEREAGFIEQIVVPMVRQRNPEARARANQTADELTRLGQQIRGSLLRTTLRDLLAP